MKVRFRELKRWLGLSLLGFAVVPAFASGAVWSAKSVPVGGGGVNVACVSASSCLQVGRASGKFAFGSVWNGSSWGPSVLLALPSGATGTVGRDVACSSATACTAVGEWGNSASESSFEVVMAERWNGKTWALQEPIVPAGAVISRFGGVVCVSAESCTAVGAVQIGLGTQLKSLAEHWNGKVWAVQTTANPGEKDTLSSISCASAESCTAVGSSSLGTLVEHWNGKEWAVQTSVNPKEAKEIALEGVSCSSAEACTAVGRYSNSASIEAPFAERWNGKEWALQEVVNPNKTSGARLNGVSCVSAESCTAVGSDGSGFAEHWNGKEWALQETPGTTGLEGVACTSATSCIAAGSTLTGGITEDIGELYS